MKTNSELKKEYKEMKFKIGVFQIRNIVNNKIYIGSSSNLDAIWNRNRTQLDFGGHPSATLQEDWKTLGADKFVFEILAEIEQKDGETTDYAAEAKGLEEMFIDDLQPFGDKGYNRKVVKRTLSV